MLSVLRNSYVAACCFALYSIFTVQQAHGVGFSTVINVPFDTPPSSIGSDTQLNLSTGGSLPNSFNAGASDGTSTNVEVNISGGTVGFGFQANGGSTVNISGGTFNISNALTGSEVNISGGTITNEFQSTGVVNISGGSVFSLNSHTGSEVNISGGSVTLFHNLSDNVNISDGTVHIDYFDGGVVSITGGTISIDGGISPSNNGSAVLNISGGSFSSQIETRNNAEMNISGGTFNGNDVAVFDGSTMNLRVIEATLDGNPVALTPEVPFTINDRGGALFVATLADGSTLDFALNASGSSGDLFESGATLTVTAVPEPSTVVLLVMGMLGLGFFGWRKK